MERISAIEAQQKISTNVNDVKQLEEEKQILQSQLVDQKNEIEQNKDANNHNNNDEKKFEENFEQQPQQQLEKTEKKAAFYRTLELICQEMLQWLQANQFEQLKFNPRIGLLLLHEEFSS